MNKDELLQAWHIAKSNAVKAVELERTLRIQIAKDLFGYDEDELQTGTKSVAIGNGYKAKIGFTVTEKLDQARVSEAISELNAMGVPAQIVGATIKYKAELSKTGYKMLDQLGKDVVDSITTKKPGMPSLEIVSPKVGK